MSGHVEKENTGIAAFMIFMFFGLLALCGLEFADTAAKGELAPSDSKPHH